MGLLEKNMKSTQTGSKGFKQVSPHGGNEKKSLKVRCPWKRVVLNFALSRPRGTLFGKRRASRLGNSAQWVSVFFGELTDCSGRKKVCQTQLVLEFWSRMPWLCATRRARSVRRTVDYRTAISRKQQGPQDCSGNTFLVTNSLIFV